MNATRIGDSTSGTCDVGLPCCPHGRTGTNSEGSPDVFINGQPAHRLGDGGATNCPHAGFFQSIVASATVFVNGKGLTRVGDATVCVGCGMTGSHVSGSDNVFAGD